MSEEHQQKLRKYGAFLVDHMEMDPNFIACMFENGVLTKAMYEKLQVNVLH